MIPEPRYVRTMPIAIPEISEPAPSPRRAKRRSCVKSIPTSSRGEIPSAEGGSPKGSRPGRRGCLAPGREVLGRPQPTGEPLEDALPLVLEELRLVVARGRLGLVLRAVEAWCAECLRALEVPKPRGQLRRGDVLDAEGVHHFHGREDLAPGDDHPGIAGELRLAELG